MKRLLILALGILLILLLSYICFLNKRESIRHDLVTQAQVVKTNPIFKDVSIRLKGESFALTRELILEGKVTSNKDKVLASNLFQDIQGITKVNNRIKVQAVKPIIKEIKSVETIEMEDIPNENEVVQEKEEVNEEENNSCELNTTKVIIEETNISKEEENLSTIFMENNTTGLNSSENNRIELNTLDTNLTNENNESNQSTRCQEQLTKIVSQKKIQFANNSSDIKKSSYQQLDQISTILQKCANHLIRIDGYSDNSGEAKYNLLLSQQRADKVKAYLLSKGIKKESIKAFGHGAQNPIASNATKQGREQNRRIEFTIQGTKE